MSTKGAERRSSCGYVGLVTDIPRRSVTLSGGRRVPYPEPTSAAATAVGKGNRRTETRPEVAIRSALHRRGFRFRKDHLIRIDGLRVRPDVVFTRRKVAVFVDGCFWHACPDHFRPPRSNRGYWGPKIAANQDRDNRVTSGLSDAGWAVVRIWEHEDLDVALSRVIGALAAFA